MGQDFDVIIIGSGVVGSAVAREISRYKLKVCVLEKELDVCSETSGRNSGVLHAGFNNRPGTLMAKYCVQGNLEFDTVAKELDIPFKRTGKVVVGFDDADRKKLEELKAQGEANGVPGLELIGQDRLQQLAPHVRGKFALYSPTTAILNPFIYTVALAENAYQNGVAFKFDHQVQQILREGSVYRVITSQGEYLAQWVINCAGLHADTICRMVGIDDYTIYPCRGEYFILDQRVGEYLDIPAYPVPNIKEGGLGIHITPTIDGNVLIGPSTEYIDARDDYAATQEIMDLLIKDGSRIFPHIKREFFIRNFCGIRPKLVSKEQGGFADFVIEKRPEVPHFINLVGIESPGLTSAVPIARRVVELLGEEMVLEKNQTFNPMRKGIVPFAEQPPEVQQQLIATDPDYGEIICRCETVTKAEIMAAINNPLGVSTVVGIKNRTRAMMGRCQGGYCQMRIAELLLAKHGLPVEKLTYARAGSNMFTGKVRN
jgi:glycerol-3-phosphate dehydrogenase